MELADILLYATYMGERTTNQMYQKFLPHKSTGIFKEIK